MTNAGALEFSNRRELSFMAAICLAFAHEWHELSRIISIKEHARG